MQRYAACEARACSTEAMKHVLPKLLRPRSPKGGTSSCTGAHAGGGCCATAAAASAPALPSLGGPGASGSARAPQVRAFRLCPEAGAGAAAAPPARLPATARSKLVSYTKSPHAPQYSSALRRGVRAPVEARDAVTGSRGGAGGARTARRRRRWRGPRPPRRRDAPRRRGRVWCRRRGRRRRRRTGRSSAPRTPRARAAPAGARGVRYARHAAWGRQRRGKHAPATAQCSAALPGAKARRVRASGEAVTSQQSARARAKQRTVQMLARSRHARGRGAAVARSGATAGTAGSLSGGTTSRARPGPSSRAPRSGGAAAWRCAACRSAVASRNAARSALFTQAVRRALPQPQPQPPWRTRASRSAWTPSARRRCACWSRR